MLHIYLCFFHPCLVILSELFILFLELITLLALAHEFNLQTFNCLFSCLPPSIDLIELLLQFTLVLGRQLNLPPQFFLVLLEDLEQVLIFLLIFLKAALQFVIFQSI